MIRRIYCIRASQSGIIVAVNNNCFNFNNPDTIPNLNSERRLTIYFLIHLSLGALASDSKRTLGYKDLTNADRLLNQNKACPGFSIRNIRTELTRNDKSEYFNFTTKFPLYIVETHVSYSHGIGLRTVATIFEILWVGNHSSNSPFPSSKTSDIQNEA